ncbi:MAG: hypothetical protein GEU93_03405 [Propionibacteriales bacterium]|nr:hypothetical protein [Propionibacteriales bacterium]
MTSVVVVAAAAVGLAGGVLTAQLRADLPESPAAETPDGRPATKRPGADEDPLYYAAAQIHDGDTTIAYSPAGLVWDLVAVPSGWVVLENALGGGRRIVRVQEDGATAVVESGRIPTIDLSADGSRVVYPAADSRKVVIRDVDTGEVEERVSTPETPVAAQFASGDVIVTTKVRLGRNVSRWQVGAGELTPLWTKSTADVVAGDGSVMALSTHFGARRGCPFGVDLDQSRTKLWTDCDVRVFGDAGSMSPDGRRLLAVDSRSDGLGPSWVSVLDADTGQETGRIVEDLMTEVGWYGEDRLAVLVATDLNLRRSRLLACSTSGDCEQVARIPTGYTVLGRLP